MSSSSSSSSSSWPFCPSCRATLRVDSTGTIECNVCPYRSNLDDMVTNTNNGKYGGGSDGMDGNNDNKNNNNTTTTIGGLPMTVTYSSDRPTPLWAKTDAEQETTIRRSSEMPIRATVEEPCIKCGHPEVGYYTVQLRSVDEGQTVFYECPECRYMWSINN